MERNSKRKKENKKIIFNFGWLYQLGPALVLDLEASSVPVV
jgi:hypothetical protein